MKYQHVVAMAWVMLKDERSGSSSAIMARGMGSSLTQDFSMVSEFGGNGSS